MTASDILDVARVGIVFLCGILVGVGIALIMKG